jgi:hypothetical protein
VNISFAFIFITDCVLGMRNRQISERCDFGYAYIIGIFCGYRLVILNIRLPKKCGYHISGGKN